MSDELEVDPGPYPPMAARCVVCGDSLEVLIDRRQPFPDHWWVSTVHDHTQDPARWVVAVHHHPDRARYADHAKRVMGLQAAMKKRARQRAEIKNASR